VAENVVEFLIKAKDSASKELEGISGKLEGMKNQMKIAGAATTAFGVAGLKMVSSARELNAQLGQTALTMGVSTDEMRDMALATTDVTFPLKSVTATFDLLSRAGIKSTETMKATAKAFDVLADATGSSAEVMAGILIPAFKNLGVELPKSSADLDKFTWLTKNTTVNLSEFGSVMSYVAQYGDKLNVSLDDMVAIMAVLESKGKAGATATKIFRTAVTQAASGTVDFNTALGVTQNEIDGFKSKMSDATGITEKYADVANEQYTIMDKVKQKFEEISLAAGSFLTPLEPILAAMTALGPVMLFFSTSMGVATARMIAHTISVWAGVAAHAALNIAMLGPVGLLAGLAAVGIALAITRDKWDQYKSGVSDTTTIIKQDFNEALKNSARAFEGLEIKMRASADAGISGMRQLTRITEENVNAQIDKYRQFHAERMDALRTEYDAALRALSLTEDAQVKVLNAQIASIDKEILARNKAEEERRNQERLQELGMAIRKANMEDRALEAKQLEKEKLDFMAEIDKRKWEETKRQEQEALRATIEGVRESVQHAKDAAQEEYDNRKKLLDDGLSYFELAKKKELEYIKNNQNATLEGFQIEFQDFMELNDKKLVDTDQFVKDYNAAMDRIVKSVTTVINQVVTGGGGGYAAAGAGGYVSAGAAAGAAAFAIHGFQHGGVVPWTGPAFLHAGETVLPAGTLITIPIYLDGDLIAERVIDIAGGKARMQRI